VEYYSTGMRQRLGIARALLGTPRVLLLDEPTRSLDQHATQRIHDLIRHLAQETGVTVLLATHQPAEAAAVCRRAAILVDGSILETVHLSATDEAAMAVRYRSIIGAV
ncbi:MAG: AAA family ATPase, partial [bacterium]